MRKLGTTVVEEVGEVTYVHKYKLSMKTAVWATVLVVVVMGGLYGFFGLPPELVNYYTRLYFHSIGIGLAALASYLIMSVFNLQKDEPPLDFPLHYRAFAATLFAAGGGLIYLNPSVDALLPDVGLGLFIVAFILIGDVGGALFIQLMLHPRKQVGTYHEKANYFAKMFPTTRKDLDAYLHAGVAYWLAIAAVGSAFIMGLIGFANLWVGIFGPSFFTGYIAWMGLDAGGFLGATLDPHTHGITLAIMAGAVAIVAQQFHVLDLSGIKKFVARFGLWISVAGVVAMSVVYLGIAFAGYSPPTFFQGGAQGVNGIAGDDATMSVIGFGALVALFPLLLTKMNLGGRPTWRDPLRMAILGSWLAALAVNVAEAFYIELNESSFQTTLIANDQVFGQVQTMFGLFVLTGLVLTLVAADYYQVGGRLRRGIGWLSLFGLIAAVIGAYLRTFVDPTRAWIPFGARVYTVLVIGMAVLVTAEAIRRAKVVSISKVPSSPNSPA
jgi:hypothetical protein